MTGDEIKTPPPRRDKRSCLFSLIGFIFVFLGGFFPICLAIGAVFTIMAFSLGVTALNRKEYGRTPWAMGGRIASFFGLWMLLALLLHGDFSDEMQVTSNRARLGRARADMRTMGLAIEEYYLKHHAFPPWHDKPEKNIFGVKANQHEELKSLPTFESWRPGGPPALTTPVAFIAQYPYDPFAPRLTPYAYYCFNDPAATSQSSWILWSPGPDREYDIRMENIPRLFDPREAVPSPALLRLTYDTSNGTVSRGDVYRFRY